MQLLRSLLFVPIFHVGTLLFILCTLAASLIGGRQVRAVVLAWANFHHRLTRGLLGIRRSIEGEIPSEPVLIAVKHQSMYETIEILRIADRPAIVLKRELADLPLFGRVTRLYGVIPVEREAGAKALRDLLARGREFIAAGRPVVIFPEGTRVPVGSAPPLRPGFAGLYRALGLPVVPIAMDSGRLWGRGVLKRSGVVQFRIGEVIPPGLTRDEIEARVHAAINALERSTP